jgi:malonyl-CoA O-methyltransferase
MADTHGFLIDKQRVRQAFDRAAAEYDRVAVLQREVGERLLERLGYIRLQPDVIVDVGAGTGRLSKALTRRYRKAWVISLDLAPNMLRIARRHAAPLARLRHRQGFVCGDAERLPLADRSVQMILSNLTLQWCSDLDGVLAEFRRVLARDGLVLFSTFGPDTLKELRESWSAADRSNQSKSSRQLPLSSRERVRGEGGSTSLPNQKGSTPCSPSPREKSGEGESLPDSSSDQAPEVVHVGAFMDMHDIGDALLRAGFNDPVMDVERFTLTYPDVYGVMRELKALGAHNATAGRPRTLTGKGRLRAMAAAYEVYRGEGLLPATFEVVYGLAWAPAARNIREAGVVKVPLSDLGRRAEEKKS